MSDREIIIRSLEKAERRLRANRLLGDLTFSLSLFLLFPLAFKIWDLFSPFRGRTVAVVLGSWVVCLAAYFVWRARKKGTLAQAAAEIDTKAALSDELKTAYWFITNPLASAWVDVQIRRAAQRAAGLNLNRLYPRSVPRASYVAVGLIVLLAGLNFAPLPWNHNWLYLQAAPAFSLTDAENALVKQIQEMLQKADQLKETDLAERLQEILKQLQEGKIDVSEAMLQLAEIQKLLAEGNLDAEGIEKGLEEIANDLQSSDQLEKIAQALRDKDLLDAAEELKKLADHLDAATEEQLRDMQKSLDEASQNTEDALKELSADLKSAAEDLKNKDMKATKESLEKTAQFLKELEKKLQNQKLQDQASQDVQELQELLQDGNEQAGKEKKPGQEAGDQTDQKDGEGDPDFNGDGKAEQAKGDAPNMQSGSDPGTGQNPSGRTDTTPPTEGLGGTELDVQLQQEKLEGLFDQEAKPEEIEEISKRERSKLDYRNIESELSPAQKDVLNQERIPWEYRPLIKNYFEAIRPPSEKTSEAK